MVRGKMPSTSQKERPGADPSPQPPQEPAPPTLDSGCLASRTERRYVSVGCDTLLWQLYQASCRPPPPLNTKFPLGFDEHFV